MHAPHHCWRLHTVRYGDGWANRRAESASVSKVFGTKGAAQAAGEKDRYKEREQNTSSTTGNAESGVATATEEPRIRRRASQRRTSLNDPCGAQGPFSAGRAVRSVTSSWNPPQHPRSGVVANCPPRAITHLVLFVGDGVGPFCRR